MLYTSLVNYLQLVVVALWYFWWEVDDMVSRCGRQLLISVNPDPLIVQSACRRSLGCVTILPCFNPNIMVGTSFPPSETGAAPGYRCFVGTPVPEAPVSPGGEFTP